MSRMLPALLLASAGLLAPACAQPGTNEQVSSSRRNAVTEAARKVSPAVVSVVVTQVQVYTYDPFGGFGFDDFFRDFFPRRQYRQEVKSMGSGVIISPNGDVITNAHVVQNATAITVTLPDNREFQAELVGIDNGLDLALLKIDGEDLPAAELGTSEDLMIGEWAIAFGNPFGFLLRDAQPTVTVGVISALHRDVKSGRGAVMTDMIQTDAAINPGNSGGPLCTAEGRVVGINTFIFSHSGGSEGIGFARPIDDVRGFVAEARGAAAAHSSGIRTAIGCTVADINSLLRARHGLAHSRGVVVTAVEPGTIAERIGLAPGDVILLAQGKVCRTARAFQQLYEKPGAAVDIVIDRAGESTRLFYRIG
ncbi:trypsin-like peptidase domain-containing protein [candidate division WOR-3 bacterium]|nr:trypsin-like peptidase domain-containing protein [candidate division WOR-3 bacterium]